MTQQTHPDALVHLTAAGVSLVLDCTEGRLPAVVHWGAALGQLSTEDLEALVVSGLEPVVSNAVDEPIRLAVLPEPHAGWSGKPGISGHRDGNDWSPRFTTTSLDVVGEAHEDGRRVDAGPASSTSTPPPPTTSGPSPASDRRPPRPSSATAKPTDGSSRSSTCSTSPG